MDKWIVDLENEGIRLLSYLRKQFPQEVTTKDLRWAVEHHRCIVNGRTERFCSRRLNKGDRIQLELMKKPTFDLEHSRILFENSEFIFYNKPAGITSEDLSSQLQLHLVHRLDRDTTGVILFAKNTSIQSSLEQLFRERKMEKSYLAIVKGCVLQPGGMIENYLAKLREKEGEGLWGIVPKGFKKGVFAKTEWELKESFKEFSLIRCKPFTGRTHQLRIHLSSIGHPILGDVRYGDRTYCKQVFRPLLHAERLSFISPSTHEEISVEAPLPSDFNILHGSIFIQSI